MRGRRNGGHPYDVRRYAVTAVTKTAQLLEAIGCYVLLLVDARSLSLRFMFWSGENFMNHDEQQN